MPAYSDERLVLEALDDSHQAFGQLVKQYQYRVLRTIASIISDEQAAQDVAQETFLLAWRDLSKLKEKQKFGRWLNQIAISSSKIWLRKQRRYHENTVLLEERAAVLKWELKHQRDRLRQEIWDAIDVLREDYREAVILHYISGYSYKEISEMLSVPVSTVSGRLQKAKAQLRKEFLDMVKRLQLEMDSTLHNFLRQHAKRDGTSIENLIVRLIERYKREIDTGVSEGRGVGTDLRLVYDPTGDKPSPFHGAAFDFSPSGDQIAIVARQHRLYIADGTGTVIRLIRDDGEPWRAFLPIWSPNGRLIAYVARKYLPDKEASPDVVAAVFVTDSEDGTSRQISPEYLGFFGVGQILWTPDSQSLSCITRDGVHTFGLEGNEVRFIPSQDLPGITDERKPDKPTPGMLLRHAAYSPDGRWLAVPVRDDPVPVHDLWYSGWTDLCMLPVTEDGFATEGHRLGLSIGEIRHCTWALDGRSLYFEGQREGNRRPRGIIWKLPMNPDTGMKEGEPQQLTPFDDSSMSHPKVLADGRISFSSSTTRRRAICVADVSRPDEVLTLAVGRNPQLSPDGQTVYYIVDDRPDKEGIYAIPRAGGTPRRLTQKSPVRGHLWLPQFTLSPDGRTIAYFTQQSKKYSLFALPVSGVEPQFLTEIMDAGAGVPQWSPGGSRLAYAAGQGLYVIPASGGQPSKLAHLDKGWENWTVRWSPDGKFLAAFSLGYSEDPGPQNAVFVVPVSGGELRQLTSDVEYKEGLEWHPDGQRLTYQVYCKPNGAESETRQAYLDGQQPTLLFDAPDDIWDYVGNWTPDGRRFFFAGSREGWGIYVYDEATGKIMPFSIHADNARTVPCFSLDGKTIAWGTEEKVSQLWTMEDRSPESAAAR